MREVKEEELEESPELKSNTEESAKGEIRKYSLNKIRVFAEALLKVLNSFTTPRERDYSEFLGVDKENRVKVTVIYPPFQQIQGCYAVNKFIDKTSKVKMRTGYTEDERSAAEFEDIEVKRDTYETLMVWGKIFFIWKGMKCIASLLFRGNYSEVSFTHAKGKEKTMKEFQKELRKFLSEHNYFKGEKIELLPYSKIRFLRYPKLSWKDLILEKELKEEIDLNLLFPLRNRELCKKYKIPWRRGVLIVGIPGTGKTQMGRVLCNVLKGVTVIWATSKAINDEVRIKNLFDIARDFFPSLIILEDIDFFGYDRELQSNPIVGELLNQLDGNASNEGIFVLATSNRPHLLDRALIERPSRFDTKLLFDVPALKEREAMVKLFSKGKDLEVAPRKIAELTDSLTGAHIKELINYSTLLALKEGERKVKAKHVNRALKKIKRKLERAHKFEISR